MPDFSNKRPAHGVRFIDSKPTVIFDTVCTKHRKPWLADKEVHSLLIETWRSSDHWLVGRYVIMPDHIHLFAWATTESNDYENWVRYWKSQFSKQHKNPAHRWQPDHWDVRMRTAQTYEEKWNYVRGNPMRHNLVENTDQWPYQGTVFELRWEETP